MLIMKKLANNVIAEKWDRKNQYQAVKLGITSNEPGFWVSTCTLQPLFSNLPNIRLSRSEPTERGSLCDTLPVLLKISCGAELQTKET